MGLECPVVTRTVSATEAKNRFGAVVKSAREEVDVVLVEYLGEPYAYILSPSEFQRLQDAEVELRKRMRLVRLEEIMREQAERNRDLTPEEADELAIRAVEEFRARRRQHKERA
jgi:prevent-host-death family protein